MIGHVSMRSVQLWIQTDAEAEVVTQYKEQGEKRWRSASSVATTRERANTAHITLGSLESGTTYDIRFMINGEIAGEPIHATTQVLWDYRMDPPAFSFVTGNCAYIMRPNTTGQASHMGEAMKYSRAWPLTIQT